jgi:thiosulfate dehydrogenase
VFDQFLNLVGTASVMRFLQSPWCPVCLGIITTVLILTSLLPSAQKNVLVNSFHNQYQEGDEWIAPDENEIPFDSNGDLIRYGKELVVNTSKYLGPKGIVSSITNGMNCQNCHLNAGTRNFGIPLSAVASFYPKWLERSERMQSIESRVNDCLQRSLNGKPLDSLNYEMRAFVAYLKWVGHEVPKGIKPKGSGIQPLAYLNRAADPAKGKIVFQNECIRCHGANGEGVLSPDKTSYLYPPLWGDSSYNINATLYRVVPLASFIKVNMPFDKVTPVLTDEEAFDVAAYISSQPRPDKRFTGDWPNLFKKPVDYPFAPYADNFSEQQHKYGPFEPIKNAKASSNLSSSKQISAGLK